MYARISAVPPDKPVHSLPKTDANPLLTLSNSTGSPDVDEADIKLESSFIDDLGADSLGLVELVLAFEESFELDIPDEDTEKIKTVQDAIDYIQKHSGG